MSAGPSPRLTVRGDASPPGAKMLGRYQLCDCIGRGGMAQVHLGRLLGPVGFSRTVAIKRLHPHLASDPEFVSMFVDEARLASRIRHPSVVPILDVAAQDEELFLVMEYVPGETLASLVKMSARAGARVPSSIAVAIVVQVLQGLQAAHDATDAGQPLPIIHRDVSPQNVLVGTDGVARLLDFGIAKARGRMHYTREGVVKGKPRYMSPEQISGEELTPATDLFAASVVLWECVTGRRLFEGESDEQIRRQVLAGSYPAPSAAADGVDPGLDAIVMRGLARDPRDRHPSAQAMALELTSHGRVASMIDVSEWVKSLATDALAHRAALVAAAEATSDASEWPEAVTRKVTVRAPELSPGPSSPSAGPGPSTGSSIALSSVVPGHTRRFGYAVAAGLGVAVAVIGGLVVARALRTSSHVVTVSVVGEEPQATSAWPVASTAGTRTAASTSSAAEDAGARAQPFRPGASGRSLTRTPRPAPAAPSASTPPVLPQRSPDGLFERN
jgi:serine/threonine-protein kinase